MHCGCWQKAMLLLLLPVPGPAAAVLLLLLLACLGLMQHLTVLLFADPGLAAAVAV